MPSSRGMRAGGFSAFQRAVQNPAEEETNFVPGKPPPPARELSVEEVTKILEGFREAIMGLAFQKALDSVRTKDWGALKKRAGVAKLLSYAWRGPVKAAGLAIDAYSFPRIVAAVREKSRLPGVRYLAEDVERLLSFLPGSLFSPEAGHLKASPTNASAAEGASQGTSPKNEKSMGSNEPDAPAVSKPKPSIRGRAVGLGEAKDILKRLKEECSRKEFQEGMASISKNDELDNPRIYSNFVCRKWAEAMRFYEFPVSPDGFREMAEGIKRYAYNRHVEMLAREVEEKLHVPLGSFFKISPAEGAGGEDETQTPSRPVRPDEVTVVLRHNTLGTELPVSVPPDATFWDLKEAAARLLGRETIKTRGRLVRKNKSGATFVSYRDGDQIMDLREVLVLGAELEMEGGAPAPPPSVSVSQGSMRLRVEDMSLAFLDPTARQQKPQLPKLTKDQAKVLLLELHAGYRDFEFQRKLTQFHATLGATAQFAKERQRMALAVQSGVLPKYGLRGSMDGVLDLQKVMVPFMEDPEMKKLAMECDELLLANARVKKKSKGDNPDNNVQKEQVQSEPEQQVQNHNPSPPDPEPEPPSKPPQPEKQKQVLPPKEVIFIVRHALNEKDEDIKMTAMSTSTFRQIRHVLATKLGRDDVMTQARFVYREGSAGVWTDFPDDEEFGRSRSELHVLGVALPSRQVSLILRHALKEDCDEFRLEVWTHWKFIEVKEVLAEKLGRPEIKRLVRFVFRPNGAHAQGAWAAWKDEEKVSLMGHGLALSIIGVEDMEPTPKARLRLQEEAAMQKRQDDRNEREEAARRIKEEVEMKSQLDAKRKARERKEKKQKDAAEGWRGDLAKSAEGAEDEEDMELEVKASEDVAAERARENYRKAKGEAERREQEELERKAQEEVARQRKESTERARQEEKERRSKEEAERRTKEEAERAAIELREREETARRAAAAQEEAERKRKVEEAEAVKKAREAAEQQAAEERRRLEEQEQAEKAEKEKKAREEEEAAAKAKALEEEARRRAAEEESARQREEEEERARQEAARQVAEEEARKAREEAEKRAAAEVEARKEAERKEEEARKAREEAEKRAAAEVEARREAERKEAEAEARAEAEREARAEEERRAKEKAEAEQRAREEREAKEKKAKEEAERKRAEEAKAEAEKKRAEEAKAKAREEARERQKQEEANKKAKEEAEKKARQEEKKAPVSTQQVRLPQHEVRAMAQNHCMQDQEREFDDSRIWLVIGGEDKGGILVRKGEGYDSKPFPIRLQTGSRIEELKVVGNRLHYKRLVGDGPDIGWVNIKLNDKVLLEPYELEETFRQK